MDSEKLVENVIDFSDMEVQKICRICRDQRGKNYNLFKKKVDERLLSEMFVYVFNIQLTEADGYPAGICCKCFRCLLNAYNLKKCATSSNNLWQRYMEWKQNEDNTAAEQGKELNADEIKMKITVEETIVEERMINWIQEQLDDNLCANENSMPDEKYSIVDVEDLDIKLVLTEDEDDSGNCADAAEKLVRDTLTTRSVKKKRLQQRSKTKSNSRSSQKQLKNTCLVCSRSFQRRSNLVDHLRLHAKVKLFKCDYCEKSFVQMANYRTHLRTHTHERPYQCHLCTKNYNQSGALKVHIRTHTNERNYCCDICDKAFTNNSDLIKHKRVHDPAKQFKCDVCQRLFAQKVNMLLHKRRIHADGKVTRKKMAN